MGDVSIERLKVLAGRSKWQSPLKSPLVSNQAVSPLESHGNLSFPNHKGDVSGIRNRHSDADTLPVVDVEFLEDELQRLQENLAEQSRAEQSQLEEFELLENFISKDAARVGTTQPSPVNAASVSNGHVSANQQIFSAHAKEAAFPLRDSIIFGDKQHLQERLRQLESALPDPNISSMSSMPNVSQPTYLGHSLSTIQEINLTGFSSSVRSPLSTVRSFRIGMHSFFSYLQIQYS